MEEPIPHPTDRSSFTIPGLDLLRQAVDQRLLDDPAMLLIKELTPFRSRDEFQELLRKLQARTQVRPG
jgi:hypothetical protein